MSERQAQISIAVYADELSTFFGRSVGRRLITIASGTLAVMLIVFLVSQMMPAIYTATATVRLARVDGQDLSTPQATAVQMNSPAFINRAMAAASAADRGDDRNRRTILDNFDARPKTSDSLTLVAAAASAEQVRNALEAAIRQLNNDQEMLRGPLLSDINAQIAVTDANIASLMRIRESLATADSITPSAPGDPSTLALRRVWLLDLTTRNEERLAIASAERRALEARIGPTKTYPASLSDDVTVVQVSPRPVRHAIFAGAIALLALLLYAMIRTPGQARAD
ncbi:hypothetical protein [Bradyrhizobium commune]|uniref:Polysaccharide chain length determinant N-terminal domain-containing protein n=1 Tax=Bradyrhizobium commune TaxID=83627 RepID=A0A7S9D9X5_9BRAD|nr:hypothetical protein [Bradyrhizobium commune]QPF93881.1 hypothetical protein IC761_11695 [Bradyrhizobium commune]